MCKYDLSVSRFFSLANLDACNVALGGCTPIVGDTGLPVPEYWLCNESTLGLSNWPGIGRACLDIDGREPWWGFGLLGMEPIPGLPLAEPL